MTTARFLCSLAGLLVVAGTASAQTTPANARFQQTTQQQWVSDQAQKNQQQAQQRQNVSSMAQQPLAQSSDARNQIRQADQAQQQRDNARQQDLVNQYRDTSTSTTTAPQGHL
ncbi:hypothetical protein IHE49_03385 [Rhodanobacter sp. 7MK24]|uniref:hypothetical protein n=1 Tax=Rhodanobacter sp. 7MK24 TaxID=2775922 RepID=UPI001780C19E|nr:hypothetical protein [Rhodanobacter sp. 7MK24]MBD8879519.1 hypothetical protein [Rhodanobacter sp. 7MK24]